MQSPPARGYVAGGSMPELPLPPSLPGQLSYEREERGAGEESARHGESISIALRQLS
ncbi:MAG: hypothetical protein OJF49_004556 [Ktedonobacterales bacterium]|nr:MAG: hypothetical protein OJF49_004556 [Ktedonobacterales bacterium]